MPDASRLHNVPDIRRLARRVLPGPLFDYIDGGAEDEFTMAENERAFREIAFRPHMGMKVDKPRLDTTVLGTPVSLPVLLAPCGLVELIHPDGALRRRPCGQKCRDGDRSEHRRRHPTGCPGP